MKLAISIALLAVTAGVLAHDYALPNGAHLVTVRGLCRDWTAYRTVERDLLVLCPGNEPPDGAVELRAYYVVR
jgi:hypothetical protein